MFTENQLEIISFCAEECTRQHSGENSVADMVRAWEHATTLTGAPSLDDVQELGSLVEPRLNAGGTRRTPVTINEITLVAPGLVPRALEVLFGAWEILSAEELYQEFETIHPFEDGNGRVGSILFNLHRGSLTSPRVPPAYRH